MGELTPYKEKEVLAELLYNEEKELRSLVRGVKQLFEIGKDGKPVWQIDFSECTVKEKIALVLSVAFFAKKLKKLEDDSFSVSELGKETGVIMTSLSKPLKKMVNNGWITKSGQKYRITTRGIKWILNKKLGEGGSSEKSEN